MVEEGLCSTFSWRHSYMLKLWRRLAATVCVNPTRTHRRISQPGRAFVVALAVDLAAPLAFDSALLSTGVF